MSDHDPLADLLRRADRPVDPSAAFADRLEARLLAELGPAAAVATSRALRVAAIPAQSRPHRGDGPALAKRPRWLDIAAAAVLLVGLMGGGILGQLPGRGPFAGLLQDEPTTVAAPRVDEPAVMEGGSPARDNRFAGPGPGPGDLVERWVAPPQESVGQPFHLQVTPYGDTVYRVAGEGTWDSVSSSFVLGEFAVSAHRLDTGAVIWSHPTTAAVGVASTEAGVVAVIPAESGTEGTARSRLALLDSLTGAETWSYPLPAVAGDNRRSPIVEGGTAYYVDLDATVYAVDLRTGAERWVSSAAAAPLERISEPCVQGSGICGFGGFALGDGALYVSNGAGALTALDLSDGAQRWQVDLIGRYGLATRPIVFPTAVPGGVVLNLVVDATDPVAMTQEGQFVRLDGMTGASVWERRITAQIGFTAAADGQRLFVGQSDIYGGCCAIVALDLASGATAWETRATRLYPLGTVNDDLLAVASNSIGGNQTLYALDPETGEERWRQRVPAGTPSLPLAYDGTMLVDAFGAFNAPSGLFAYRLATVAPEAAAEEPAVMEGGSAARDNWWPGSGLSAGTLEARWSARLTEGTLIPGVVPFRDLVYVVIPSADTPDVRVEARDVATGEVRWSVDGGPSGRTSAVSADGVLLLESGPDGPEAASPTVVLRMLDLTTGEERWRYEVGPTTTATLHGPIVADGTVYYVDAHGVAYALDAATGAERWVSRTGRAFPSTDNADCGTAVEVCYWGSSAYRDGVLYLVNSAAEAYALDAATGSALWKADIRERYALERMAVTLMATGRGVVVSMIVASKEQDANGYFQIVGRRTALLDPDTGEEVWTRDGVANPTVSAADDERLYLVQPTDVCCSTLALDLATGATVWTVMDTYGYPVGLIGGEQPTLVWFEAPHEEQVFIVGIDPATGTELWRLETDQDYPILPVADDGTVFVQESDGTLTAFRLIPASPGATPVASPVASPAASPAATPVAG